MKLSRASLVLGVGALILAGCDYPTELPNLEQRWILPVETTTISVDEFLPASVTVDAGGNFALSVDAFSTNETLGQLCGCTSPGFPIPAPGFTAQFSVSQSLPADVPTATLAGGTIDVSVTNGFSFDPIRLPSGATGTMTITVTDGPGGAQLGQVVIDGADEALPAGGTVTKAMTLASRDIDGTVVAAVVLTSATGAPTDLVTINTSESLTVGATPNILIASATVNIDGQTVDFDPVDLDVEDMDDAMTDRIQQGSVIIDVVNPFGVAVNGVLSIGTIHKPLSVSAAATDQVILSYSGDDLRAFLGKPNIQFSGSGTISASGPVTVSPGQAVTLAASIDLTLLIG